MPGKKVRQTRNQLLGRELLAGLPDPGGLALERISDEIAALFGRGLSGP
jgi:hypothetical protein